MAPVLKVNPTRNVFASVRGVEALRLDTAGPTPTIAVVLLNWTDNPLSSVTVTVAGAAGRTATSVEVPSSSITKSNSGSNLNVTLPLNTVDILTIR